MFGMLGREFTFPFRYDTPLMTVSLLRTFRLYIKRRSRLNRPLRSAMQPTTTLDIFKNIILLQLSHTYTCGRLPSLSVCSCPSISLNLGLFTGAPSLLSTFLVVSCNLFLLILLPLDSLLLGLSWGFILHR